jgi:plastocyanin
MRKWKLFWTLSMILFFVPGVVSGGSVRVSLRERAFTPQALHIRVGDKVEWLNDDEDVHLVISGKGLEDKHIGKPLDSGTLMPGQTFSYTFTEPGTYPYLCVIHWQQSTTRPPMRGEVIVEP